MRAIVIDDEQLALASMARMLNKYEIDVCGTFQDPRQALAAAGSLAPNVAFVDIEMPGYSGLETAERLLAQQDIRIVFVTAYNQYAIDAFELNAIDYLLKPVQPKRLEKTLERLRQAKPRSKPSDPLAGRPVIRCFGRLDFLGPDGQRLDMPWRTSKAKEMFAYLIHLGERVVTKDGLTDMLWPELDEEKAQTNLHTTVYQIRRMLKNANLPIVLTLGDGGGYWLKMVGVELETKHWEAAVSAALAAKETSLQELERLMDAYRGDYLEQEGYLWAENERLRLRMKWLEVALAAAGLAEESGRQVELIAKLTQIRERFPYSEDSYMRLMSLYDRLGMEAQLRQEYERLRAVHDEELGVPVSREVEAWYEERQRKRRQ